jgi:hypothetical protein
MVTLSRKLSSPNEAFDLKPTRVFNAEAQRRIKQVFSRSPP